MKKSVQPDRTLRNPFFGSGEALDSIREALADASVVRIATAYFEPSGWRLLRDVLRNREVRLLVGRPDISTDSLRSVLDEFLSALQIDDHEERTRSLFALKEALSKNRLIISVSGESEMGTLEARYIYHHAKLYIADETEAVVTSANFTAHGLRQSREAGITVLERDTVRVYVERFDDYFGRGIDITQELLELLQRFLLIRTPHQVYIRSLLEYYGLPEIEEPGRLPEPVEYQKPVISGLIRNIEELGGAFLIASTGLGKTVMAAHTVARLHSDRLVDSVLLFCPAGLKEMWRRTLRAARVSERVFSYHNLSSEDWRRYRSAELLEEELQYCDEKTLILLDESHHLRNESAPDELLRRRNRRIRDAVERGAKILLMTATPYSRGVDDINAQLGLLPQTDTSDDGSLIVRKRPWSVDHPSGISDLSCAIVLTAPTVVRHFSLTDEANNRYVLFAGDQRMYFPHRIHIRSRSYENPFDEILKHLLNSGLLARRIDLEPGLFETGGRRDPLNESRIIHQFCSSAGEALNVCDRLSAEGGYERLRFQRQGELTEYLESRKAFLNSFRPLDENSKNGFDTPPEERAASLGDAKIRIVLNIIDEHYEDKIVIFCHYRKTAEYVTRVLKSLREGLEIEHTIDREADDLESILRSFAPLASESGHLRSLDERTTDLRNIRILVATGALSEGFNLQDAPVLINYDLPWTVLVLAQRMGRILRPWRFPRDVYIYNLIPSTMEAIDSGEFRLAKAWKERLLRRSQEHMSFAQIPVMMEHEESVEVFQLGGILQRLGDMNLDLDQALDFMKNADHIFSSSFLDDLANLSADELREIRRIPAGFRSYAEQDQRGPMLYLLLRWHDRTYPALFSLRGDPLEGVRADELFQKIRSDRVREIRPIGEEALLLDDERITRARREWAGGRGVDIAEVTVICALSVG